MKFTRRHTLKGVGSIGTVALAGCTGDDRDQTDSTGTGTTTNEDPTPTDDDRVRAAFVYHDVIGDFGWQWSHDQARRIIDEEFEWLETQVFEQCDPSGSAPRFKQYAERGFDVVFGTSWDYMDPMYEVAPDYPDVAFEHCSGIKQRENMGRYFGRMYQPRYLTGVAAGMLTEAKKLGYVAAFPTSEVVRGINAFTLGARSIDEEIRVVVKYTGTWNNAGIESSTAENLIGKGVDVMAQHQNYPAAAQTANDAGIWATGYNSPMGEVVGENYVTSPIWNWEVFYRPTVRAVRTGTWNADFYWNGLDSGIVDLSDWGPNVPGEVKTTVAETRRQLVDGDLDIWADTQFADFDDAQLFESVDMYVDGVTGDAPK
jgi:basic membrane protein A